MAQSKKWSLPQDLRPDPGQLRFDFERAARSVVLLRSEVPPTPIPPMPWAPKGWAMA